MKYMTSNFNVANGGKHGYPAMFQLRLAAAGDAHGVSISREGSKPTEANWRLNDKLILERAQRRCSVQGTVAPVRASEAIVETNADDCLLPW